MCEICNCIQEMLDNPDYICCKCAKELGDLRDRALMPPLTRPSKRSTVWVWVMGFGIAAISLVMYWGFCK